MAKGRRNERDGVEVDLALGDGINRSHMEVNADKSWPPGGFEHVRGGLASGCGDRPFIDDEECEPEKYETGIF